MTEVCSFCDLVTTPVTSELCGILSGEDTHLRDVPLDNNMEINTGNLAVRHNGNIKVQLT